MPAPGLDRRDPAGPPRGIVLMLHGGAKAGLRPGRLQERLVPAYVGHAQRPREAGPRRRALAVAAPVRRARLERRRRTRALARARRALGARPGGGRRTPACRSCCSATRWALAPPSTSPTTRASVGVVALAPWLERSDPVRTLAGRHLIAGHGSRDRITSARMTRSTSTRARDVAASARVRRHGPARALHAAPAARVEPVRPGEHPRGARPAPCRARCARNASAATMVEPHNALSVLRHDLDERPRHESGGARASARGAALRPDRAR